MNNKSVLVHEYNCFMAEPIFLGVFENINNAQDILKEANEDYHYFEKLTDSTKSYQKGEQVLKIVFLDDKYKKGEKIAIECEFTIGSLSVKKIERRNLSKMERYNMKVVLPREVM